MKFKIEERKTFNLDKYKGDDIELAKRFSSKIQKELGDFLKTVVLFGSTARKDTAPGTAADIDILLIINDMTIITNPEVIEAYRIITHKTAVSVSKRLHITTLKLSTFWEYVKNGDPVIINMLRDGVALYDTGFFEPTQALLTQGRVRPSDESVWVYFSRAPTTLLNSRWHVLQATLDLYWAVVDAAHAALMSIGEVPPSPGHVAEIMDKTLARKKLIAKKHVTTMDKFYKLSKKITHRQLQDITGMQFEKYYKEARAFVNAMQKVIERKEFGKIKGKG